MEGQIIDSTLQGFYINVLQADMKHLKVLLKKYISERLSKVDLSDNDIMAELNASRRSDSLYH